MTPRARHHEDRAGDPLEGLVNLFDLGIVLSVGFLLAALSALGATNALSTTGRASDDGKVPDDAVLAPTDAEVNNVPPAGQEVVGRGERVGTVYQLDDGRLIYVVPAEGESDSTPRPAEQPPADPGAGG